VWHEVKNRDPARQIPTLRCVPQSAVVCFFVNADTVLGYINRTAKSTEDCPATGLMARSRQPLLTGDSFSAKAVVCDVMLHYNADCFGGYLLRDCGTRLHRFHEVSAEQQSPLKIGWIVSVVQQGAGQWCTMISYELVHLVPSAEMAGVPMCIRALSLRIPAVLRPDGVMAVEWSARHAGYCRSCREDDMMRVAAWSGATIQADEVPWHVCRSGRHGSRLRRTVLVQFFAR